MRFAERMLRLYAVTDRSWLRGQTLAEQVEAALKGGATCVQLREKDASYEDFLAEAVKLRALCSRYGVPLIINDNVELAIQVGADGVHVGQEDMDARDVRAMVGREMIIGVTAKTVEQALRAQRSGADYLGSGAVFGSATKPGALPMTFQTLQDICHAVSIPVIAIGGIHRGNLAQLQGTDIRGVAVVSGIFAAADIEEESRCLRKMIDTIVK